MLKLNESRLEIEIRSPSELIAQMERFKENIEKMPFSIKEIENNDELCIIVEYPISNELRVLLTWKPLFNENGILTNL